MVFDGRALTVEGIVGCAVKASLAGTVELAAAELAEDWRSQLGGCASGEHFDGVLVVLRSSGASCTATAEVKSRRCSGSRARLLQNAKPGAFGPLEVSDRKVE